MSVIVIFEWTFSPPDYFEVPIEVVRSDYTLKIAHGKAEAKVDAATYDASPSIRETIGQGLNDRFLGVQLLTRQAYELSVSTMTRVHPDGRRNVILEVGTGHFKITGQPVDFRVTDKDGNITADTKRDRIEKKRSLAELVSTYRASDQTLASLLRSHNAAVRDPNNELVHLYEIRDALSVKFGQDKKARTALRISSADWSRFGRLCNDEPLHQGRHRGKTGGVALRDATESELSEARRIALGMIEAYLLYLDSLAQSNKASTVWKLWRPHPIPSRPTTPTLEAGRLKTTCVNRGLFKDTYPGRPVS